MCFFPKEVAYRARACTAAAMSGRVPRAAYMSDLITSRYGYEETMRWSSEVAGWNCAFAGSGVDTVKER